MQNQSIVKAIRYSDAGGKGGEKKSKKSNRTELKDFLLIYGRLGDWVISQKCQNTVLSGPHKGKNVKN